MTWRPSSDSNRSRVLNGMRSSRFTGFFPWGWDAVVWPDGGEGDGPFDVEGVRVTLALAVPGLGDTGFSLETEGMVLDLVGAV